MENSKNLPNSTSIIDILTLRYDTTQKSPLKKLLWNDCIPQNNISLDEIENNIENTIKKTIGKNNPKTISIALSGGIDSLLTLSALKKIEPKRNIDAISIKFANSVDETSSAKKIADHYKINHHILELENYLEELPKAISIIKLPFWDLHWYYIAKKAKTFSNFLASGDGGDELFGGYTFRYKKFLSLVTEKSTWKNKILAYLECHERDRVPDQDKIFGEKSQFSWTKIYSILKPYFDNSLPLLQQVFLADFNGKLLYNFSPINSSINKYFEITSITPILSNEMIRQAMSIPSEYKYDLKTNIGKIPLRKILSKYELDPFVTEKKLGFSVNTTNLWKNHGQKLSKQYLLDSRIVKDKWINGKWIKKYLDNDELDVRYVNKFLGLLALEIWYRIFITNEIKPDEKLE